MEYKIIDELSENQKIVFLILITLVGYFNSIPACQEIYNLNDIEVNDDVSTYSYKNYKIKKYNFDLKDIFKNNNTVLNNNLELINVYMMNNIQIMNWNMRANNLLIRLNQINNQNIIIFINNDYNAVINQGELLLANNPNTNPILTQQLEDQIRKLNMKLLLINTFKIMFGTAILFGFFTYLVDRAADRFEGIRKIATEFREINDTISNRNFSDLRQNRTFMGVLWFYSITNFYRILRYVLWFRWKR